MREFQPAGVLVASVNGNIHTYAAGNGTSDLILHSSSELDVRSPMSLDSQFPILTAASSTLSIVSQTQQYDWPEFRESYNSIMDNTNLLDSCAAALNEINSENGLCSDDVRHEFNRSVSSTTNSSFSGSDSAITTGHAEQFIHWLCEMEKRVADLPTLSKIWAMTPKQRATQVKIHSNIYKEIMSQTNVHSICKTIERGEVIENRYHLLYLKVYEVLLLVELDTLSPSKRILSESFTELELNSTTSDKNQTNDSESMVLDDVVCDRSSSDLATPVYTETSILSGSIGTYYFNYDDTIEQQADNNSNENLNSTIFGSSDKEFTFENYLNLPLNTNDDLCSKIKDNVLITDQRSLTQQQRGINDQMIMNDTFSHHKVYDWLHSKKDNWKSKSSNNLTAMLASETDYQLLYRSKSEMDLSNSRPSKSNYLTLQKSLNCLSTDISPVKYYYEPLNVSIPEDGSLVWDNFQMGHDFIKADNESSLMGSDVETKELSNKLCYFGDDYSLHLNESSLTESELDSGIGMQQQPEHKTVFELAEAQPALLSSSSSSSKNEIVKPRRSRRLRKKRAKNLLNSTISDESSQNPTELHSDETTTGAGLSEATTASVNSKSTNEIKSSTSQNVHSHEEFTPEKTISYNSCDKQFELHTKESTEPKRMKINEMRPEDFYDIVNMCQSNIDCVITVLGADPNRRFTVAYCQQMKLDRYQKSNTVSCKCKPKVYDAVVDVDVNTVHSPRTKDIECNCNQQMEMKTPNTCVCAWISHTIAMILNFLIDCWNIFRNMKLYTYLCRVTKALFGSTRYVADHLKSKRELVNAKAIKYS